MTTAADILEESGREQGKCYACGILTQFRDERRETDADAWGCPPLKPKRASVTLTADGMPTAKAAKKKAGMTTTKHRNATGACQ